VRLAVKDILSAAYCSLAVYESRTPEGLKIKNSRFLQDRSTDTEYAIFHADQTVIISIAGSDSWADWLSNLKIKTKACFGWLPAHRGFAGCAEAILTTCLKTVRAVPHKRIIVTGHSRGGAVAVLLAIGLQANLSDRVQRQNIALVTFGQPRVSRKALINAAFTGPYFRVQNGSDAVCRRPLFWYSHAGTNIYLRNGTGWCQDPGMVDQFTNRLFTWFHERATDHSMTGYVRALIARGFTL